MTPEAIEVRDAIYDRLVGLQLNASPYFRTAYKVPVELEPNDDLPALIVHASREQMSSDGDLNAGEPTFVNDVTLSVYMRLGANSREDADARLNSRANVVLSTILCDADIISMFEGVQSVTSTRTFSKAGEQFFGNLQIDIVVQFRTAFEPKIYDAYEGTDLVAQPLANPNAPPVRVTLDQAQT